jgi:predicted ATPase
LDWSHDHLSGGEQVVLRRVAIFAGHFALEAALAVAAEEGMGESAVADAVGSLVEKSLIGVRIDFRGTFSIARYHALLRVGKADCRR